MNDVNAAAPHSAPTLSDQAARGDRHYDLDRRIARLEGQARAKWSECGRKYRWTLWMRLSWAWPVSESVAARHIAAWAARVRKRIPGAVILTGFHTKTGRRHVHTLLFLPRRGAPRTGPRMWLRGVATTWHQTFWPHGLLWLDRYAPGRTGRRHGAPEYLASEPETVELFGAPVPYVPRRKRRQ